MGVPEASAEVGVEWATDVSARAPGEAAWPYRGPDVSWGKEAMVAGGGLWFAFPQSRRLGFSLWDGMEAEGVSLAL